MRADPDDVTESELTQEAAKRLGPDQREVLAMSFTHKNLKKVEGLGAGASASRRPRRRTSPRKDMEAENTGLSYHVVRPDQRQGFGHRHENAEEIYVVLSGSGRVKLDDEVVDVDTMDAIRVAPNVARAFEAGSGGPRAAGLRPPPRRRRRAGAGLLAHGLSLRRPANFVDRL